MDGFKITVVVPQEIEAVGSATPDQVREATQDAMVDECGGCTVCENARGVWNGGDGLVDEPVDAYTCVGEFEDKELAESHATLMASLVDRCTTEDSVFYQVEEVTYGFT